MSADRWVECLQCQADSDGLAYGEDKETMREDFWVGIAKGEFGVEYRAACKKCGFQFKFKHEQSALARPREEGT